MATPINTIKNWFRTNLYPSQTQFWSTWDSFWHKDESIPQNSIANLQQSLDAKVDQEALHAVAFSGSYNALEDKPAASLWKWIEGSEVLKAEGNEDEEALEDGDTVRFKPISNGGLPMVVVYGIYDESADSGDKQSEKSYTIPTLMI